MKSLSLALGACALAASAAFAQQPSPLDNVPDKMPFDVPYGAPISLEHAQAAVERHLVRNVVHRVGLLGERGGRGKRAGAEGKRQGFHGPLLGVETGSGA